MFHVKAVIRSKAHTIAKHETQLELVRYLTERGVRREEGRATGEVTIDTPEGIVHVRVYDGNKLMRLHNLQEMGVL